MSLPVNMGGSLEIEDYKCVRAKGGESTNSEHMHSLHRHYFFNQSKLQIEDQKKKIHNRQNIKSIIRLSFATVYLS